MCLLAEGDLPPLLNQSVAVASLVVSAITLAVIIFKAGGLTEKLDNVTAAVAKVDQDLEAHKQSDASEFRKIDSWHRRVVVAIAKLGGSRQLIEEAKPDEC